MQKIFKGKFFSRYLRYILCDACITLVSFYFSIFVVSIISSGIAPNYLECLHTLYVSVAAIFVIVLMYILFGVYNTLWRFAGLKELVDVFIATLISAIICIAAFSYFLIMHILSVSIFVLIFGFIITLGFVLLSRLIIKGIATYLSIQNNPGKNGESDERIMIIGAGQAADILLREYISHNILGRVKCVIDDDENKFGASIHGIKIVGNRNFIEKAIKIYDINVVIFAIPSMPPAEKNIIYDKCKSHCKVVKTVPSLSEIVDDYFSLSSVKKLKVEDLLGRDPIDQDLSLVREYIFGKCVAVTGGGGSIGSELCRQLARYSPKKLIIIDIYENNAYDLQQELISKYPTLDLEVIIASVRDKKRMLSIFEKYHPNVVYHAAAHKHVPLMENSPREAVKNNVFGTLNTAYAASEAGVEKFVMISTDKAVNPTNVMGATKRICEMIVQSYNNKSNTDFVAVRFGNVLGSNGSVIPLFKKQIEKGGPVTVTHPDIIRYFMTIPEAASLVLQAGVSAKGGEIFILDMGRPVKILDLAENVIRLSGYTPYEDIDIVFTGLRPGEKLYEELLLSEEGITKTDNELIFIGKPMDFDVDEFYSKLNRLNDIIDDESSDIRLMIAEIVPTYKRTKEK